MIYNRNLFIKKKSKVQPCSKDDIILYITTEDEDLSFNYKPVTHH